MISTGGTTKTSLVFLTCVASLLRYEAVDAGTPELNEIVVSASKLPQAIESVPAMITVVTGDDMRARGATDLRSALALVSGVDVAPGSDAGPASSVPGMWGLREFDAFLLVVDGVPYGGAFNPALSALDLTDVAKIEVLRGSAPVAYGATSFVGVIHVIHSAAGETTERFSASAGPPGAMQLSFSSNLPDAGRLRQSVALSGEVRSFAQDDSRFDRLHVLYRSALNAGSGLLRADAEVTVLNQRPYSPHPREGTKLSTRFPLDANVNPADARQDLIRTQGNLQFTQGAFSAVLSVAQTDGRTRRGYLRADFSTDGRTPNADGFRQKLGITDVYLDTHVTLEPAARISWVSGVDWLYGNGRQSSQNFEYAVLPDGSSRPLSTQLRIDESTELRVRRSFGGLYSELGWQLPNDWHADVGVRLNSTRETRAGTLVATGVPEAESVADRRSDTRWSGTVGVSHQLWRRGQSYVTVFADHRDSYKPAAANIGPEAEAGILQPETAASREAGLRGHALDGRIDWEASYFDMDFRNLVIVENVGGLPALANAGSEHFTGAELEATWRATDVLQVVANYARHDARFKNYARLQPDGSLQQLAGKYIELSPRQLAAVGINIMDRGGFTGSIVARYTGSQFLNKSNSASYPGYASVDAGIGYRSGRHEFRLDASNLTDRRDPASESELGDAQFYRLPGRSLLATFRVNP